MSVGTITVTVIFLGAWEGMAAFLLTLLSYMFKNFPCGELGEHPIILLLFVDLISFKVWVKDPNFTNDRLIVNYDAKFEQESNILLMKSNVDVQKNKRNLDN